MWLAALWLCAAASQSDAVPVPRGGLWAKRVPLPPKPAKPSGRPSLWSHQYEPRVGDAPFLPSEEHVPDRLLTELPPIPKFPALAPPAPPSFNPKPLLGKPPSKSPGYTAPPSNPFLKPPSFNAPAEPVNSALWAPKPLVLAKKAVDIDEEDEPEFVDSEESEEASQEALQASDPILAKLDNIFNNLHAMRHHDQGQAPGKRLGVTQLRQHVVKAPLPLPAAPPAKPAGGLPKPAPPVHKPKPAPPQVHRPEAPRPELAALRKQTDDGGLNRLFGGEAGAPTVPPPVKKKVSLVRLVGAVTTVQAAPAPERSLASIYAT